VTGLLHIVLARKPLEGTVAENCLQWGCGALWIDGCRVGWDTKSLALDQARRKTPRTKITGGSFHSGGGKSGEYDGETSSPSGRFPANLILGGEEVAEMFPSTHGRGNISPKDYAPDQGMFGSGKIKRPQHGYATDGGSTTRFFFNFAEQESDE
jgi:site-specific DNA-methyltransferase (adenine-specific)